MRRFEGFKRWQKLRYPSAATRFRPSFEVLEDRVVPVVSFRDETGASLAQQVFGVTGKGVAIVIIDRGVGYGTLTAGIAAANGRAFAGGKYQGMAPGADLIIVKSTSDGAPAHDGQPPEAPFLANLMQALDWVDQKITALQEPAVGLINSGVQWGPIDGTSDVSRKIDQVFGLDRPGRIYVS